MLKTLIGIALPWLSSSLAGSRTYILSIAFVGAAAWLWFAGHISMSVAILSALGGMAFMAQRAAVADVKQSAGSLKPYVLMLDKLLERFGYKDLDVLYAKLEQFLADQDE